jgi:hypothetical protein
VSGQRFRLFKVIRAASSADPLRVRKARKDQKAERFWLREFQAPVCEDGHVEMKKPASPGQVARASMGCYRPWETIGTGHWEMNGLGMLRCDDGANAAQQSPIKSACPR